MGTAALLIFLAVMAGIAALALLTSVVGPARLLAPPLSVPWPWPSACGWR